MVSRAINLLLSTVVLSTILLLSGCRSLGATLPVTPEPAFAAPLAPSPLPTSEPTAPPARSPVLLFGAGRGKNVIVAWSAGQTGHPVAPGRLLYGHAVSPDGRRMVTDTRRTSRESPAADQIAIVNLSDGRTEPTRLLSRPYTIHWSPDGLHLLYSDWQESDARLVLYDVARGDNTPLANMTNIWLTAGWSADGRQIAFVGEADGQYDLYVLDVASRAVRRLTNTPDVEIAAQWSPVDDTLLVGSTPYDENVMREGYLTDVDTLHLIDSDGQSRLLATYEQDVSSNSLAWSTDGQRIALSDNGALCILDLATNDTTCPLAGVEPFGRYLIEEQPAWSHDDRWLAFRATGFEYGQCFGVYALELATGEVSIVEEGSCETGPLYWVEELEGATH